MLDNITKNRINAARDILVGKVPDPKSQVEQITIALIYKFMDDMDLEAEELGGSTSFFVGEYEKYGWRKIFDPALGGHEMLGLYGDAITKMALNPNLPQLFRDIFKNAYLPYRDPETLKLFLKTINEFSYDHSEMLGDAFEYLLSVLGSQGDAGQFRTPRHIIDFIVKLIDPKKNESICDPACGTAGFLISSYKHIVDQNSKKSSGDLLTPDDRKRMMENFAGYDISPDMVRLSLVNMYLHGFTTPQIYEYDSLTSEDRWNEYYDVFLANPPFMTPKGGIRPSKKFSIDAKKAEVLFTDYMAEHLTSAGRAGIIVPNGIVGTTQTAYTQLRKLLVENSLIGVISLPAGVFQPYSGVKTSILILDKQLAKNTNNVLFLKIENDGFELGAQRREHSKNDLPGALKVFAEYKNAMILGQDFDSGKYKNLTLIKKETILNNKNILLSADRYNEENNKNVKYEIVKLENVATLQYGYTEKALAVGDIRFVRITDISENGRLKNEDKKYILLNEEVKKYLLQKGDLLVARTGATYGKTMIYEEEYNSVFASFLIRINFNKDVILPKFYWCFAQTAFYWEQAKKLVSGGGQPQFNGNVLKEIKIPLPPLQVQQQIVNEINGYLKIIDGAKQIVNNYTPNITIRPEWKVVELGSIAKLVGGGTPSKENSLYWENGNIDWITCSDFSNNEMYIEKSIRKITEKATLETSTKVVPENTLIMITRVSLGKFAFTVQPTALNQDLTALIFDESIINKLYAYYYLISISGKIENDGHGATVKGVTRDYVKEIKIPLPPFEEQKEIVRRIQEEQYLINSNKKLITLFQQKINNKINTLWNIKEIEEITISDILFETKNYDLYLAIMQKQIEKKLNLNYGEVAAQKTVFHITTFTDFKFGYSFKNYNYGTFSSQLKEDLATNPYLTKTSKGNGEVFTIRSEKEKEVLAALNNPENKDFLKSINHVLKIYNHPFINKETEKIELLNTVSKVILDIQSTDLESIYKSMQIWEINQNGYKTKADKFNKFDTNRMIEIIVGLKLVDKLIM